MMCFYRPLVQQCLIIGVIWMIFTILIWINMVNVHQVNLFYLHIIIVYWLYHWTLTLYTVKNKISVKLWNSSLEMLRFIVALLFSWFCRSSVIHNHNLMQMHFTQIRGSLFYFRPCFVWLDWSTKLRQVKWTSVSFVYILIKSHLVMQTNMWSDVTLSFDFIL